MFGACIASAFLAMGIYHNQSKEQRKKGEGETVLMNIVVTLVFSLIMAAGLVFYHAPWGH